MIQPRYDQPRGCGFRKAGGLYLMAVGVAVPCGKLPLPLTICPTCSAGIHFSRGWTWVDADKLFAEQKCSAPEETCRPCPLSNRLFGKAGLLWIGEQFYKTPADWLREAERLGISRRVHAVPREFELGKTWVLVAHMKGAPRTEFDYRPGALNTERVPAIFQMFKPTAIEYVVKGTETDEEIAALEKRGITPVKVEISQPEVTA